MRVISSIRSALRLPTSTAAATVVLLAVFVGGLGIGVAVKDVVGQTASPVADTGCDAAAAEVGAEPFTRTELFFGTSKPDGTEVTDEEWNSFLDEEITPRFPAGLTALTGYGQFENASGTIIEEESILLILLYPAETAGESSASIEEIRDAYEQAFEQESVLRADDPSPVCTSF